MKFKSGIITQASGSIGGLTASHNKGGMYFRARSIPTDPASAYQVAMRNAMVQLASRWSSTLTQAKRDAWDVYAVNVPLVNAMGDPVSRSGQQMYCRSSLQRLQAGLAIVDDAPEVFDLGTFSAPSFGFDAASDEIDVTFTNGDEWANEDDAAMLVYVSRPQNAGINFFKGPYRYADKIEGDSGTPPTSPAAIALPFAIAADQRVFAYVAVTREDGRLSSRFRGTGIGA